MKCESVGMGSDSFATASTPKKTPWEPAWLLESVSFDRVDRVVFNLL